MCRNLRVLLTKYGGDYFGFSGFSSFEDDCEGYLFPDVEVFQISVSVAHVGCCFVSFFQSHLV